jgi:hypothetical protein
MGMSILRRLSVPEGDVAYERKQLHLFVENAGWIVLFRLPVEPAQFRVRERAPMALKLLPAKPCSLANCSRKLAISLPVSKIRTRVFGSSSMSEQVSGRPPKAAGPAMQVHVQLRSLFIRSGNKSSKSCKFSSIFADIKIPGTKMMARNLVQAPLSPQCRCETYEDRTQSCGDCAKRDSLSLNVFVQCRREEGFILGQICSRGIQPSR